MVPCVALHRSFPFKLEIHQKVLLCLSSHGNRCNNQTVANGFLMIGRLFWNPAQDEAFLVINTFQSLCSKSANTFSILVIFLRKLTRTETIRCTLGPPGMNFLIKSIPYLPIFSYKQHSFSYAVLWWSCFLVQMDAVENAFIFFWLMVLPSFFYHFTNKICSNM